MDNERIGFSYNSNISRFTGQPEQHYGTYAYLRHMLYAGSVGFAYATWRGHIDWRGLVESALQEIKDDASVSRDERDMLRWIADRHAHCQRCMHRFVIRGNVGMNTYKSWQRLSEFKLWRSITLLYEGTRLPHDIILRVYEIASGTKNKPACCLPFTQ